MAKERAASVLRSLNVPECEIDTEMLETTVGFLSAFDKMDVDQNGYLTRQECIGAIQRLNPNEDPDKFIMMCDLDSDGVITQGEFVRAFAISKINDRYCGAFQEFDTNGDGKIDREELGAALQKRGYTKAKIDKLFAEADVDKSGYISYYEFAISVLKDQIR